MKFTWTNMDSEIRLIKHRTYIYTYIVMLTLRKRFPSNNAFPLNFALDWISRCPIGFPYLFDIYIICKLLHGKNYFIIKKFSYFNIEQNENNFRDTCRIFLRYFIQDKIINKQIYGTKVPYDSIWTIRKKITN